MMSTLTTGTTGENAKNFKTMMTRAARPVGPSLTPSHDRKGINLVGDTNTDRGLDQSQAIVGADTETGIAKSTRATGAGPRTESTIAEEDTLLKEAQKIWARRRQRRGEP